VPTTGRRKAPLLTTAQLGRRVLRHFVVVLGIVTVSLGIGMWGYIALAGMNWVDAFMNSAMLLGGMGPVGDLQDDEAKIFAGVYALYAGLVFIVCAGIMVTPLAHHLLHRFHVDDGE
jgi:uncharacterized protein involved in cysteine biosynthesis